VPGDLAETMALGKVDTKSDVNAPTVITIDSPVTSPPATAPKPTVAPTVVEKRKPEPAPPAVDAGMTVAESASMGSSATAIPDVAPPAPRPVAPIPAPAPLAPVVKKKSSAGLIIGVIALLLVVGAVGAASIFLWNRSRTTTPAVSGTTGSTTPPTAAAPPKEISRYWLELVPASGGQAQVAGLVPIASGQSFRFHLVFSEAGYVYIFGPGGKNQPTAFLTTKPLPDAGVTSNQVSAGSELTFPQGKGNKITLDKNPGTDVFTIVFAKTQLPSPAFLNEPVTGEPLSAAQQAELKSFVTKYAEKPPVTELDESNPRAPLVRVKVPAEAVNNPIVFDIRIQHN
jgi:Domain of unknown function (DUF4384)